MDGLLGEWIAAPRRGLVCVCVFGKGAMVTDVTDGHGRSMKDDENQLGTLSAPHPILSNDHGDLSIQHGFPPFSFSVWSPKHRAG